MLDPLSGKQRSELTGAMAAVDRLLTAGSVTLQVEDPSTETAQLCLHR
ncbi:MAG: hypothetical protein ABSG63_13350 [Spirochaetia bacterium]|jgi:hypothetical protein